MDSIPSVQSNSEHTGHDYPQTYMVDVLYSQGKSPEEIGMITSLIEKLDPEGECRWLHIYAINPNAYGYEEHLKLLQILPTSDEETNPIDRIKYQLSLLKEIRAIRNGEQDDRYNRIDQIVNRTEPESEFVGTPYQIDGYRTITVKDRSIKLSKDEADALIELGKSLDEDSQSISQNLLNSDVVKKLLLLGLVKPAEIENGVITELRIPQLEELETEVPLSKDDFFNGDTRMYNAVKRAGIQTVEALLVAYHLRFGNKYESNILTDLRNVGEKTIKYIEKLIETNEMVKPIDSKVRLELGNIIV